MSNTTLYGICVLIWGTTWFAITAQIAVVAPEVGVTIRFGLAAATLMAVCWLRDGLRLRYPPRLHALFAIQGLTAFCASYVCVYEAERFVVSGVVAVGYAASPLFGLVLARVFLGTRMSARVALGGVVGIAGVALIFWHEFARLTLSQHVIEGAELTMVSVLLASLGTIAAAGYHREHVGGWGPLAWSMSYGSAGALAYTLANGTAWNWSWHPAFLGSLLYLALFGSIAAFGAYITLVRRVGPAKAGYIGVLTPVVALVISSAWEGFVWTGLTVAGIALAIVGNVIALWPGTAVAEG